MVQFPWDKTEISSSDKNSYPEYFGIIHSSLSEKGDGVQIPYISFLAKCFAPSRKKKEELIDTEVLTTRITCQIQERSQNQLRTRSKWMYRP